MREKHDRKDIELLAAKKITYIEVNKPSTSHIYNFLFGAVVYKWVTSDPKIILRTENAKNMGPTPITIILGQKQNIKKLRKMLLSKLFVLVKELKEN